MLTASSSYKNKLPKLFYNWPAPLIFLASVFFFSTLLLNFTELSALAATTEKGLRAQISREEENAKLRRTSLQRLSNEEKVINESLAKAEKSILAIEDSLAKERSALRELARSSEDLSKEQTKLSLEISKLEKSMGELLGFLWELSTRRESVGGKLLEDWPDTDREYYWTSEILKTLGEYKFQVEVKRAELQDVVSRRDSVHKETNSRIAKIEKDRQKLLNERIKYDQNLAVLRKEKLNVQAELNKAIKLINQHYSDIKTLQATPKPEKATGSGAKPQQPPAYTAEKGHDIDAKSKGKLYRPTQGKLSLKFSSRGASPMQGLGFSTGAKAPVMAVHAGKVMYSDTMRGLGQVVVVQHGKNYFSVYAHLSETMVLQGQNVTRGQRLGSTGAYPEVEGGKGLYFELRYHQDAINPEPWLEAAR